MRKQVTFLSTLLIGCLLFTVSSVNAQDDFKDEELAWIAAITDAVQQMRDLSSYGVEVIQNANQVVTSGTGNNATESTSEVTTRLLLHVIAADESYNYRAILYQEVASASGIQTLEATFKLDMIAADGNFYLRATYLVPETLSGAFPEDWVDVNRERRRYPTLATLAVEDPEVLFNSILTLDIDENTVLAIEAAEDIEVDGQNINVFEVEYSLETMLENASSQGGAGIFSGAEMDDIINQLAEGGVMNFTIWIGEDDGLIHRIDSIIHIDAMVAVVGTEVQIVEDLETDATYADFGINYTIEAPDI